MNFLLAATETPSAWRQFWLGKTLNASPEATQTEWLYMFILWVNILSFAVVMALMLYFALKYRRSAQKTNYQVSAAHNTPLELAWSIIPLLVMIPIFWWGFRGYVGKLAAPADSEDIMVQAQKWAWSFTYRNGATPQPADGWEPVQITHDGVESPVFAVPAGRPVRLVMTSVDVLHAFYVPDFRTKIDVTPNRYTSMWFTPDPLDPVKDKDKATGKLQREHNVYCAEYCGDNHSDMMARMRVIPPAEYDALLAKWTEAPKDWSALRIGEFLYKSKCASCHSVDGKSGTGPTWKGVYGHEVELNNGQTVLADENYLRESILIPQAKIVKGFGPNMPSFQGQLKPRELNALVMYIKSLSDKETPEEKAAAQKTGAQIEAEEKNKK
jgi:cytochrome c oxidase subunit II